MKSEKTENTIIDTEWQTLFRNINNKLTWIIFLLVLIFVGFIFVYSKLIDISGGLETISDRIDLTISAIESGIRNTITSMDYGMEQIFDRMGEMRIY